MYDHSVVFNDTGTVTAIITATVIKLSVVQQYKGNIGGVRETRLLLRRRRCRCRCQCRWYILLCHRNEDEVLVFFFACFLPSFAVSLGHEFKRFNLFSLSPHNIQSGYNGMYHTSQLNDISNSKIVLLQQSCACYCCG